MAIVPIAIGVTNGDIAKIDGNTGRRSGTGDCYSRSRQRKGNNSAFKWVFHAPDSFRVAGTGPLEYPRPTIGSAFVKRVGGSFGP